MAADTGFVSMKGIDGLGLAGAICFWSLSGTMSLEDLQDSWAAEELDPKFLPVIASPANALGRAVAVAADKRTLVRPLKQGLWEIITETIVETDDGPRTGHTHECRVELVAGTPSVTPAEHRLAAGILRGFAFHRTRLTHMDVSAWLSVTVARMADSVGLRDRGGVYFVPADRVDLWRRVTRAVEAASANRIFEVPAVKTDGAVEAILASVRRDAEFELQELETYMAGDVSTKGLNSMDRRASATRAKIAHYAALLGATLPDLNQRLETLTGAVVASRLLVKDAVQ